MSDDLCVSTSLTLAPPFLAACGLKEEEYEYNSITVNKFCTPGPCNAAWSKLFNAQKAACLVSEDNKHWTPESCCANKQACIDASSQNGSNEPTFTALIGTGLTDPVPTGSTTSVSATASAGSSATGGSASSTATSTAASGDAKSSAKALNKSIFSLAVIIVFSLFIN
ncbi:hypothetical protein HDU92_002936 [Lobulomyces angularis]|nr:hypothetical protein HDU92_002936 [Lobulomyces angularis]